MDSAERPSSKPALSAVAPSPVQSNVRPLDVEIAEGVATGGLSECLSTLSSRHSRGCLGPNRGLVGGRVQGSLCRSCIDRSYTRLLGSVVKVGLGLRGLRIRQPTSFRGNWEPTCSCASLAFSRMRSSSTLP